MDIALTEWGDVCYIISPCCDQLSNASLLHLLTFSFILGSYDKDDGPQLYMVDPSGISYVSLSALHWWTQVKQADNGTNHTVCVCVCFFRVTGDVPLEKQNKLPRQRLKSCRWEASKIHLTWKSKLWLSLMDDLKGTAARIHPVWPCKHSGPYSLRPVLQNRSIQWVPTLILVEWAVWRLHWAVSGGQYKQRVPPEYARRWRAIWGCLCLGQGI